MTVEGRISNWSFYCGVLYRLWTDRTVDTDRTVVTVDLLSTDMPFMVTVGIACIQFADSLHSTFTVHTVGQTNSSFRHNSRNKVYCRARCIITSMINQAQRPCPHRCGGSGHAIAAPLPLLSWQWWWYSWPGCCSVLTLSWWFCPRHRHCCCGGQAVAAPSPSLWWWHHWASCCIMVVVPLSSPLWQWACCCSTLAFAVVVEVTLGMPLCWWWANGPCWQGIASEYGAMR